MIVFSIGLVSARAFGADDYVWWEGEKPAKTNFPTRSWFSASTFPKTRGQLSGGAWLSSSSKRSGAEVFATYSITVPAAGSYTLHTRKFYKHGPFRWRFDTQKWATCGRDIALIDSVSLKKHTCANWVHLGKVKLSKGTHTFELRLLAADGQSATAAFDCFVLTAGPFAPNGKRKPGAKSGQADEGFFAWEPSLDGFSDDALLDLRGLNEKVAGQSGFVRRRGKDLTLGGGKPVRFWAVNVSSNNAAQPHESVDYLARKLAKLGVNMVRFHSPMFDRGGDVSKVDPKKLDNLHYLVAAMKKQGIYTKISFYFPLWFDIKKGYGIPGYDTIANKKPFALLYFDKRMQGIHRSWARGLLTTKNPYTGVPLASEPAVAIVEIINEDNYFFWTFGKKNIPPVHWRRLEVLYNKWRVAKGIAGKGVLTEAWGMTGGGLKQQNARRRKETAQQVRFLTMHQRKFYQDTVAYLKKDLGYRGLVSCSNWKTADANILDALERYTYTAGDVIDRHGYFGPQHKGDGASYSVRVGHTYRDRAAVLEPQSLPIQVNQVAGYPHIISELGWPNPNRFRADCTFLTAAYGAMQGVDGVFIFAVGSNYLTDQSMSKFAASCPVIAGTFPAAALAYRRGDAIEPAPAVRRVLRLEDLFALKGSAASAQAFDKLRLKDVPAATGKRGSSGLDPLSFYVGPVERVIGAGGVRRGGVDLSKYINHAKKKVTSIGRQLAWDYGRGLVTINTPRCQGAAGFLSKGGPIVLSNVTIASENEYGAIIVISLDGKTLASSRNILIQAMTEERPYGFRAAGGRITNLGSAPFGVRNINAVVTFKGTRAARVRATALDENGYPRKQELPVEVKGNVATVKLSARGVYHVITR
jgi:hypothetical protein